MKRCGHLLSSLVTVIFNIKINNKNGLQNPLMALDVVLSEEKDQFLMLFSVLVVN